MTKNKTDPVKGFKDYTGKEAEKRAFVLGVIKNIFEKYGFEPAETPIIENEEFVKGSSEQLEDDVISDIYKLKDKGKRKLALRYEFTFQLKRLMQNKKLPYKRYQVGAVFRDEPIKGNRFRQFTQADADIVGSTLKDDAEILALCSEVLKTLGVEFVIYFNNRKLLNEILEKEGVKKKKKVIKEIDKLDKLPEKEIKENLKKYDAEKIIGIFKKDKKFFEKYESYSEIKELEKFLKNYGIKAKFSPSLARGLGYYNGTVFEVKTKKIKETIVGGGAYNFNNTQCTGISFGLDRITNLSKADISKNKYLVVSLDQDKETINLTKKIRKENICSIFYGKPSKALEYANSYDYNKVVFVGKKEVQSRKFKVKDMKTGREKELKL